MLWFVVFCSFICFFFYNTLINEIMMRAGEMKNQIGVTEL